jgi:hypothetical protein
MKNQKLLIISLLASSFFLNACRKCDEPKPRKHSHDNQQQGFCGTTCNTPNNGTCGNNDDNPEPAPSKTGH